MTTSPTGPGSTSTAAREPLRIRLTEGAHSGPLDGAWWPQSRDLQDEAADLVDHFPTAGGRIARLLFSRPDWDPADGASRVRRVQAARGPVKVGSFPSDDTHVMVAQMLTGQRLRLLVIPSDTEPAAATELMDRATDTGNDQSAGQLLGLPGPDQAQIGSRVWDDHGNGAP